jgi:hypothetical protein
MTALRVTADPASPDTKARGDADPRAVRRPSPSPSSRRRREAGPARAPSLWQPGQVDQIKKDGVPGRDAGPGKPNKANPGRGGRAIDAKRRQLPGRHQHGTKPVPGRRQHGTKPVESTELLVKKAKSTIASRRTGAHRPAHRGAPADLGWPRSRATGVAQRREADGTGRARPDASRGPAAPVASNRGHPEPAETKQSQFRRSRATGRSQSDRRNHFMGGKIERIGPGAPGRTGRRTEAHRSPPAGWPGLPAPRTPFFPPLFSALSAALRLCVRSLPGRLRGRNPEASPADASAGQGGRVGIA